MVLGFAPPEDQRYDVLQSNLGLLCLEWLIRAGTAWIGVRPVPAIELLCIFLYNTYKVLYMSIPIRYYNEILTYGSKLAKVVFKETIIPNN